MKKIFIVLLLLSASLIQAYDCTVQSYKYKANVSQISPKKIKVFMKDMDYSVHKGLQNLDATAGEIQDALDFGLKLQGLGNESMVYDVDALLSMKRNSSLYELILDMLENGSYDYYTFFQASRALRVVEQLRSLERTVEVEKLEQYISDTLVELKNGYDSKKIQSMGSTLHEIRSNISNTGKISSKKRSVMMCQSILDLNNN